MKQQFQDFFQKSFSSAEDFLTEIAEPIFGKDNITKYNDNLSQYQAEIEAAGLKKVTVVADIDIDGNPIRVYDVIVKTQNLERSRVGIKQALIRFTDVYMHAFILFHYEESDNREWRFSYFYKADKKQNVTPPKRYTYLVGAGNHCRTIAEQLDKLAGENKTDKTVSETFGVQALSDDFFKRFTDLYQKFVTEITGTEFRNGEEESVQPPSPFFQSAFGGDSKAVRDFVKKMQGRIVFLHFLQKKGWLCGDRSYLKNLFEKQTDEKKADFLEQVLEPLFFGVLNTKPEERHQFFTKKGYDTALLNEWNAIPYLNGGLFENNDEDDKTVCFYTETWQEFFNTLSEYNFTIDENDPDDVEVGIDPEMLGRIFESQLEDNKAKGAFYTPKEIVQYMCRESLAAYLCPNNSDAACINSTDDVLQRPNNMPHHSHQEAIAQFIQNPHEKHDFSEEECHFLLEKLKAVKICDPAIGSGAFPMGMLNLLYQCRRALGEPERNEQGHTIRRQIVENNIYGVDIERGAIDIARLRFWLALIVEEEKAEPLPNFDYKFMQGNSLLESFDGVDLSQLLQRNTPQTALAFDDESTEQTLLNEKLKRFFNETDHARKAELRDKIQEKIINIAQARHFKAETITALRTLGVQNTQFFLWHTWFADVFEHGGFDIVIGNPPYISIRTKNFDSSLKQAYKKDYTLAVGQYDVYILFIELAHRLIHEKGILSYIVPTRLLSNENFQLARMFLENNLFINKYVNAEAPFENTKVEANIMVCSKCSKSDIIESYVFDNYKKDFSLLTTIIRKSISKMPFMIFPFVYSQEKLNLFFKIQNSKTDLLSNFIKITRGFECGYNDSAITRNQTEFKLIKSESIEKYVINNTEKLFCTPDFSNATKYKSKAVFENLPKFVTKFCSNKISFALDTVGYYNTNSIYNCQLKNGVDKNEMLFLLAILNSSITTFWFNTAFMNIDNLFPHIQKNQLESIPIPAVSEEMQRPIILLVEQILEAKRVDPQADTSALEAEIDRLVYALYGLSEEEIKVVQ